MAYMDGPVLDTVALAASAGGLVALREVLGGLPGGFPATIYVVQHRSSGPTLLPQLLGARCRLPVKPAEHTEIPRRGTVYVAPPGRHLRLRPTGALCVRQTEPVRFFRPCADLLFESLAEVRGDRTIAVVLTGLGDDGAKGARTIRAAGGFVLVQDEASSKHFDMPRATIERVRVDLVLPLARIAFALTSLVMGPDAASAHFPDPGPVGRALRTGPTGPLNPTS